MNRRHLAVIAVVIAVGLFAAPLISPVPSYGPHLEVSVAGEPQNFSAEEMKERGIGNTTTAVRYQTLPAPAQRLFERINKHQSDDVVVSLDEAPEWWATRAPKNGPMAEVEAVYVRKDGLYYPIWVSRFTPGPSFQAFMLRLGPLLGAIGLGTLAGYFVLTAED